MTGRFTTQRTREINNAKNTCGGLEGEGIRVEDYSDVEDYDEASTLKKKTFYTSRFVRVILVGYPCYSFKQTPELHDSSPYSSLLEA